MAEIDHGTSESRGHGKSKLLRIVMAILTIAILVVSFLSLQLNPLSDSPKTPIPARISYTAHGAIDIYGNSGFNNTLHPSNGVVSGNGTASNPYIIEGWDIDVTLHINPGIIIQGTTAHFIIRNCYIHTGNIMFLGIGLDDCVNGTISDNLLVDGLLMGIYLYSSSNNTLINNTCSSTASGYGIYFDLSSNNNLTHNTCSGALYDIYLDTSSNNNLITQNWVNNSAGEGVRINSGSNNRIWNNTFYHNKGSGDTYSSSKIQAYDAGTNNWWNTSGSPHGYGNYWSDLTSPDADFDGIVDWSYNLTGSAGAKDWYPRTTPTWPIPEFYELIIPIAGLMLIALIFNRTRKKP
jgi:parallel beta-helix repeat protein